MPDTRTLQIIVKIGPVAIPSLDGKAPCKKFPLLGGITAKEEFLHDSSAFYVLTLEKSVGVLDDISSSEKKLLCALGRLAEVWPFAAGSLLGVVQRERLWRASLPPYESNAEKLKHEMRAKKGITLVSRSVGIPIEHTETYERLPLERAIQLYELGDKYESLRDIFRYYYRSNILEEQWPFELYKIIDIIKKDFRKPHIAINALSIQKTEWGSVEKALNTQYRHANNVEIYEHNRNLDKETLFRIFHNWIYRFIEYLEHKNV